jgi:hypothetical protein
MCQLSVPAGNWVVATQSSPSVDGRLIVVEGFTTFTPGFLAVEFGHFYRSVDGRIGLALVYCGTDKYRWYTMDVSTMPATTAVLATITGPAWAMGEKHTLGVTVSGSTHTFMVDGSTIGTGTLAAGSADETRHGIILKAGIVPSRIFRYRGFRG